MLADTVNSETLYALLWIVLPGFVAVGSALLSALIMQARMEASLARERAATAEARALALAQNQQMEERIRAAEEAARRQALEELLSDLRIEERRYIRESRSLFVTRKCLVVQERLFFRNLPLSDWIEREYWLEETGDSDAQTIATASRRLLPGKPPHA